MRRRPAWRPNTIGRGLNELAQDEPSGPDSAAGGRAQTGDSPKIRACCPISSRRSNRQGAGIPVRPSRGPARACEKKAEALRTQGHRVSHTLVAELLLSATGCSLRANRKIEEGDSHPAPERNSPTSTSRQEKSWKGEWNVT
ncbi:MAG: hypothetical protein J2P48_08445 [Alphaproteobacteria bacterium]|nr:hypothetical protein [Alphaproteobacteria bacterium]